jgi:hypothetical protein
MEFLLGFLEGKVTNRQTPYWSAGDRQKVAITAKTALGL